jgi:hypothetical protein
MSEEFMKKPCAHCPFRNDVKPYLTTERAEELAYAAQNPYSSFPCHKTTEYEEDDNGEGEMVATENSKQCAGFLTLRSCENGETDYDDQGFVPSFEVCYSDSYEMIDAYEQANEKQC